VVLTKTTYPREEMVEMLKQQVCQVKFIKTNGEERIMQATLKEDIIPPAAQPRDDDNGVQITIGVVKCWDVEKEGWRSFRVDSVLSFSYP
tara:strand:- start:6936 stop:7205 length:270 start_codon:yes stop_codon:yes gene_type:complete